MIDDIWYLYTLIDEMSSVTEGHADLYLIGGGAMMFLGSKEYTKDIDLVVSSKEEFQIVIDALSSLGFRSDRPSDGMGKVNISDTQVRGRYRVDLFNRVVCGQLQLSESMKKRSHEQYRTSNYSLHSCSAEDIFLLKSVTEREGDISDCNNLIRVSPEFDWNSFIEELKVQISFGNPVWITYVMDRMIRMDFKNRRPDVFKRVFELEEEYLQNWADGFESTH